MTKIFIPAIVLLLVSCSIDGEKQVERDKFTFKTGDDTELFFKNIRASYYQKEERKEMRWDVYRHRDLYNDTSGYAINAAIVVNVVDDMAYVLIEPGEELKDLDEIIVFYSNPKGSEEGKLVLDMPTKEAMLEFASGLYEAIQKGYTFYLRIGNEVRPVFDHHDRREAFRITLSDYYRLTRIF